MLTRFSEWIPNPIATLVDKLNANLMLKYSIFYKIIFLNTRNTILYTRYGVSVFFCDFFCDKGRGDGLKSVSM